MTTNQVYADGSGNVSGDALNTFEQICPTVAFARGFVGVTGMSILLQGTNTPGDGGQGEFWWNAGNTASDDDGATTIVPYGSPSGAAWTRLPNTGISAVMAPVVSASTLAIARNLLGVAQATTVAQFGALGNGSHDDAPAINAAITSLGSAGGVVLFGPGNFLVSSTAIIIPSNVILWGAGRGATVITGGAGLTGDIVQTQNFSSLTGTNAPSGPFKWGIRDISINGNKSSRSGTGNGVSAYGFDFNISNVEIYDCLTNNWYSEWSTSGTVPVGADSDSMEAHVDNLKTFSAGTDGIVWFGPHDSTLNGIQTFLNGRYGLNVSNTANYFGGASQFTNFHSYANTSHGVLCNANIFAVNFESEANTGDGIHITDTTYSFLSGSNITTFGNGGAGINHLAGYIKASSVESYANTGDGVILTAQAVIAGLYTYSNGSEGLFVNSNEVTISSLRSESNGDCGVYFAGNALAYLNITGLAANNTNYQVFFASPTLVAPAIIDLATSNNAGGQFNYGGTMPSNIYLRIATGGTSAQSPTLVTQTTP